MALRPRPARWFEVLVARDELPRTAEALARSGAVEVECPPQTAGSAARDGDPRRALERFDQLARRYGPHWPEPTSEATSGPASDLLDEAVARIEAWAAEAQSTLAESEDVERELDSLALLTELIAEGAHGLFDLGLAAQAGPSLAARAYVEPLTPRGPELPPLVCVRQVERDKHRLIAAVGARSELVELDARMQARHARRIDLPSWVAWPPELALSLIETQRQKLESARASLRARLDTLAAAHGLAGALGVVERIRWYLTRVPPLPHTRHFALITGWTDDASGARLRSALDEAGVAALLDFPEPPEERTPPALPDNPRWVRPFEKVVALLGTPALNEVDPAVLVTFVAPILFGFMFGDAGHGAVLVIAGLWLGRNRPALRLLVPGGLASIGFGLLFGTVFAREDWLPALWLRPMDQPLTVLAVSVAGGALLLITGLALRALVAHWQAPGWRFVYTELGLFIVYLSLLGAVFAPRLLWLTLAGALWHTMGAALTRHDHAWRAGLAALGDLVERVVQLAVNTVSFARVGAFALAHAGLSAAVVTLSNATNNAVLGLAVAIVGNALVIALEGLAVGIQTTRLVLFEFFVRFLKGEGRTFKPLLPPGARLSPTGGSR